MARTRRTLAQATQERITADREQAERDQRWDETMQANRRPEATPERERPTIPVDQASQAYDEADRVASGIAVTISLLPPTDGEQAEDQALDERGAAQAPQAATIPLTRYTELVQHLAAARALLWARLNEGRWEHEETIEALLESHHRLGTMLKRLSDAMLQLPLPERKEASDGTLRGV